MCTDTSLVQQEEEMLFFFCAVMGTVIYSFLNVISRPLGSSKEGSLSTLQPPEVSHSLYFPEACLGRVRKMREEVETRLIARD